MDQIARNDFRNSTLEKQNFFVPVSEGEGKVESVLEDECLALCLQTWLAPVSRLMMCLQFISNSTVAMLVGGN